MRVQDGRQDEPQDGQDVEQVTERHVHRIGGDPGGERREHGGDLQDGHDGKFPSGVDRKFPSGVGRKFPSEFPAASAADNERPLERHEPNKATIYRVTIQVI